MRSWTVKVVLSLLFISSYCRQKHISISTRIGDERRVADVAVEGAGIRWGHQRAKAEGDLIRFEQLGKLH